MIQMLNVLGGGIARIVKNSLSLQDEHLGLAWQSIIFPSLAEGD